MMPVDGESRAAVHSSAGSSARASSRGQRLQVVHAVGCRLPRRCGELLSLRGAGGDDQLAAAAVGDAALAQ
jgi:hypothetical protein